ncbi:DUF2782 domain-containing protein [Dokdonella soli]|uniref:DUF2782 domain-containing protein n=1 Tax=Dokdonella soli TaxID=529810 RepID=A0ABN1IGW5_9GAMM
MKPTIRLLFTAILLACMAGFAATVAAAAPKSTKADVPRPPGLNDPGVSTPATSAAKDSAPAATENATEEDPLAPLPKPDARLIRDKASRDASATAQRIAASEVTTRKQGSDTVEEYREHGHVWMIKIVPRNGPAQTFMDNDGSGRLVRDPNAGPISPVYYTLYEWK